MQVFSGSKALSAFKTRRLLAELKALAPSVQGLTARFAHLAQLNAELTEAEEAGQVNPAPRHYLNRLSDLLFVLARVLNRANLDGLGGDDVYWKSERLARSEAEGN